MGWLAVWPLVAIVAMLVLYRWRAPATPKPPLVALGLLIYAAGGASIGSALAATVVGLAHGASPFGLPLDALGLLAIWWLTAGFAARCGVHPHALLHILDRTPQPPPDRD